MSPILLGTLNLIIYFVIAVILAFSGRILFTIPDEVFRKILKDITSNPLAAIANANYLSILFWAVVIGLALKIVASERTIASMG